MKQVIALAQIILAFGAVSAQAAEKGNIGKGQKIAEKHCTRCHVVGSYNPGGGISSTPSFQLLVKRRPDYKERFRTFYARRPHPAFLSIKGIGRIRPDLPPNAMPIELTQEDVLDVSAFIETLKPKKRP
jgi:mono/diheme cytochrome c family protein